MKARYKIRLATPGDIESLVAFTVHEAQESQGLSACASNVRRGVQAAFEVPPRATYWVVESLGGELVASTSIITEWSDFHGAEYWWVQSLYIVPGHRGKGLIEQVFAHLSREAAAANALDLRLYVHHSNERAIHAYERCGFVAAPYMIMQKAPHAS